MAGLGKLLKQAQKMQQQMQALESELGAQIHETTYGGGAIRLCIDGHGQFQGVKLDPEFLKEDHAFIEETLLKALQEAQLLCKTSREAKVGAITEGMPMPGLGGLAF